MQEADKDVEEVWRRRENEMDGGEGGGARRGDATAEERATEGMEYDIMQRQKRIGAVRRGWREGLRGEI